MAPQLLLDAYRMLGRAASLLGRACQDGHALGGLLRTESYLP
jgi:hypothetical protein